MTDFPLPEDLPEPVDDGAAAGLPGTVMPHLALTSTDGEEVGLDALGPGRTVLYVYPMTGRPGVDLPEGWDAIPGARGCTPEARGFCAVHGALRSAGVGALYGISSQDSDYQRELVQRLELPFAMLADPELALARQLGLPTFEAGGMTLYRRLTLVVAGGRVEHVFYPVFPPDTHADEVLAWLRATPEPAAAASP